MSVPPSSEYTSTFLTFLSTLGKSVLVSTYQAQKLILVRAQNSHLNTHFVTTPKPMGMAFQHKRLSIGSGNHIVDYFNLPNVAHRVHPTNTHDGAFFQRRVHVTGDIDIHEMAFDNKNALWFVNTKMSCLCTLDDEHSFVPRWRPQFITAYDTSDRCHLNGLAIRDGKPRYVTALGSSDRAAGWRNTKKDGGIVIDINSNEIIADGLCMPHSPRWYRDKLWVLESGRGELISIDESSGKKTIVTQLPGFCRGIDFIEQFALIGLSEVRETAVFAGLPLTEREQHRKCGVWIVNIESGAIVGHLEFTKGVEEIFAVQTLPAKYPALLELDHELQDTSYVVPKNLIGEFVAASKMQNKIDEALALHRDKQYIRAIALYQKILMEEPNNPEVQLHRAEALSKVGQWDEARRILEQIIAADSKHALAHNLLGQYHAVHNDFNQALEHFNAAINSDGQFASAYYRRGCIRLVHRNFDQGWQDYAWRTRMPGFNTFSLPHPEWRGEDISDKTLLILTEKTDGDALLFARFLPCLKGRCKKLIVACDERLKLLFNELEVVDEVREHGTLPVDLFDTYSSIMSLGEMLNVNAESLSVDAPYLAINDKVIAPTVVNQAHRPLKIGLFWRSNDRLDDHTACHLSEFISLTENLPASFFSLQPTTFAAERELLAKHNINNLAQGITTYSQAGALMQQMDLIVTVTAPMAHLSGALALPTLVLAPYQLDWQWADTDQLSNWYPGVRVLRQKKIGDWTSPLEQCRQLIGDITG